MYESVMYHSLIGIKWIDVAQAILNLVHRSGSVQKIQVFLLAFDLLDSLVDDFVLIRPVSRIDERPHIVAVIVATFRVEVERWRQSCAFVAIDAVEGEEPLDLSCKLVDVCIDLLVVHSIEHRNRAETLNFSKLSEHTKLSIGQPHVFLIGLGHLSGSQWA